MFIRIATVLTGSEVEQIQVFNDIFVKTEILVEALLHKSTFPHFTLHTTLRRTTALGIKLHVAKGWMKLKDKKTSDGI